MAACTRCTSAISTPKPTITKPPPLPDKELWWSAIILVHHGRNENITRETPQRKKAKRPSRGYALDDAQFQGHPRAASAGFFQDSLARPRLQHPAGRRQHP